MERKWVHILFAAAGLGLVFLLVKTSEWVWSYFAKPKQLIIYTTSFLLAGAMRRSSASPLSVSPS